ncbi:MAG: sensor histidine kinase [Clostridiales bacterium]|nr:sensor histidine kinase [Clostridiales bacterium]
MESSGRKRQNGYYLATRFTAGFIIACAGYATALAFLWRTAVHADQGYAACICLSALLLALLILMRIRVFAPYKKTERMLGVFSKGYSMEGINSLKWQLTPGTEGVVKKFEDVLTSDAAVNLSKRQAQFLAMQNQINPHFLYNTLDGIRGEALAEGNESIAKMTETLSQFFRYTISNLETLVTLDDELVNVRNYYSIQRYRFGDRIEMNVVFENEDDRESLLPAKMPKLILQPIVENAIIHGIEGIPGTGRIIIRCQFTGKRMILTVSDNGVGMGPERLRELNDRVSNIYDRFERERGEFGGIALSNVNNRIKLLFGEDYGINILSEKGAGTDVEITLPYLTRYGGLQ